MDLPITDDRWFTERAREFEAMDRDQLLHAARAWAFNAQQYKKSDLAFRAGTARVNSKNAAALARAWKLVDVRRKTIRMDDLRTAIDDEYRSEQEYRERREARAKED